VSFRVPVASPRSGAEIDAIALRIIKKFQPKVLNEPAPFNIEVFFECDLEGYLGLGQTTEETCHQVYMGIQIPTRWNLLSPLIYWMALLKAKCDTPGQQSPTSRII
jgi:hypothetical protein